MNTPVPRTFLLMRLANGWSLRLFRINNMPEGDIGTVPLDDVYIAKNLKEVKQIIEELILQAGSPDGIPIP